MQRRLLGPGEHLLVLRLAARRRPLHVPRGRRHLPVPVREPADLAEGRDRPARVRPRDGSRAHEHDLPRLRPDHELVHPHRRQHVPPGRRRTVCGDLRPVQRAYAAGSSFATTSSSCAPAGRSDRRARICSAPPNGQRRGVVQYRFSPSGVPSPVGPSNPATALHRYVPLQLLPLLPPTTSCSAARLR